MTLLPMDCAQSGLPNPDHRSWLGFGNPSRAGGPIIILTHTLFCTIVTCTRKLSKGNSPVAFVRPQSITPAGKFPTTWGEVKTTQ
ncbi:hypothetical protein HYR99_14645 [Candidatus Poribacteria bacterium]|nr:hypothetical protein [Candidatus Poribacteria bacterium]